MELQVGPDSVGDLVFNNPAAQHTHHPMHQIDV